MNVLIKFLYFWISCFLPASFSHADENPQYILQSIDWKAANEDLKEDNNYKNLLLKQFRAEIPSGIEKINLPVLVPRLGPVRSAPNAIGEKSTYTSLYALRRGATLSIHGSSIALSLNANDPLNSVVKNQVTDDEMQFDQSELICRQE